MQLSSIVAIAVAVAAVGSLFLDADFVTYMSPGIAADSFAGQVVWITGASSGIGAALARELAAKGARVIISARRVEQLNEVAASCVGPHRPFVLPLDVTNLDSQKQALVTVLDLYHRIDSVVLNAGQSQRAVAEDTSIEDTRKLFELNYFSVVSLAQLILPVFRSQARGQFVVVSSVSGLLGTPLGTSYSSTKFALQGYFNGLRSELGNEDINVLMVCPGPVESDIARHALRNPQLPHQYDEGKKMPTGRCVYLMTKAMKHRLSEIWIAEQPILLLTYLAVYAPGLTRQFMKIAGPARVKALKAGGNMFDIKGLLTKK